MNLEFKTILLQELHSRGYKYIVRDDNDALYAFKEKPTKHQWVWSVNDSDDHLNDYISICVFNDLFQEIKWEDEEPFFIGAYIEGVNWLKIPINTNVFVRNHDDDDWYPRHFAGFDVNNKEFPFKAFKWGRTKWTNSGSINQWAQCKLAENK